MPLKVDWNKIHSKDYSFASRIQLLTQEEMMGNGSLSGEKKKKIKQYFNWADRHLMKSFKKQQYDQTEITTRLRQFFKL